MQWLDSSSVAMVEELSVGDKYNGWAQKSDSSMLPEHASHGTFLLTTVPLWTTVPLHGPRYPVVDHYTVLWTTVPFYGPRYSFTDPGTLLWVAVPFYGPRHPFMTHGTILRTTAPSYVPRCSFMDHGTLLQLTCSSNAQISVSRVQCQVPLYPKISGSFGCS